MSQVKKVFADVFVNSFYHTGHEINLAQNILIGLLAGVIGGLSSILYHFALDYAIESLWNYLFEALHNAGMFHSFPTYNYIWMSSFVYMTLLVLYLKFLNPRFPPGGFGVGVGDLHKDGFINPKHYLPMFFCSLMSLASGSGVGPEAPVMILGGTAASFVAQKMRLPKRIMRLFVLSGICGAHSGFFASPISGIFGLESVHRLGLEYFEAFVPGIVASFVGGTILPLTYQRNYGSIFTFENSMTVVPPVYGFYGIALGMMGGLISFYFYCLHRLYGKIAEKLKLARFASFLPYVAWVAFSLGGMCLPAILFWGEPELRNIISLNSIPLAHYEGGSSGLINLGETYTAGIVFAIGITKLTILPFNIAMGLKGGIVFPLFFIGGTFGQFVHMVTGWDQALCVCAIMAAAQGAITSTPLASALVAVFNSKGTCPQLLIPVTIASFTATFLNYHFQVFPTQKPRNDFIWQEENLPPAVTSEEIPMIEEEDDDLLPSTSDTNPYALATE